MQAKKIHQNENLNNLEKEILLDNNRINNHYHQVFFYLLLAAVTAATFYLIRNYISTLLLALIFSLFLQPIYKWLRTKLKGSSNWAVMIAVTCMCLLFIVPIILFLLYLTNEIVRATQTIQLTQVETNNSSTILFYFAEHKIDVTEQLNNLNNWLQRVTFGQYSLTLDQLQGFLQSSVGPLRQWALKTLLDIGSGSINFIVKLLLFLIFLVSLIPNQQNLVGYIKKLSPFNDAIDDTYLLKVKEMTTSMVKGAFFIAALQSSLSAVMLWIAGVPYILTLFVVMLIASLLPMLGAPLITVPIGIFFILNGELVKGLIIILIQVLVISNLDNILRPRMVSKNAMLHPALLLLGVFGGLEVFGFLGVIYGPVVMILFVTTLEVYMRYYPMSSRLRELDEIES